MSRKERKGERKSREGRDRKKGVDRSERIDRPERERAIVQDDPIVGLANTKPATIYEMDTTGLYAAREQVVAALNESERQRRDSRIVKGLQEAYCYIVRELEYKGNIASKNEG